MYRPVERFAVNVVRHPPSSPAPPVLAGRGALWPTLAMAALGVLIGLLLSMA